MPKNENGADRQDVEWGLLYKKIDGWLRCFGTENALGEADFWVLDDNWGSQQQKVVVNKLAMLRPEIIEGLRKLLRDFPSWEIIVALDLGGDGKDWPNMGLTIRANEIIDGLQRAYFPREFQSLHYEASRIGTEFD